MFLLRLRNQFLEFCIGHGAIDVIAGGIAAGDICKQKFPVVIFDGFVRSQNLHYFVLPAKRACPGMIEAGGISSFQ